MLNVKEIQCKSVLSKSNLPGSDYTINPYVGCFHGCSYCYARFMKKYSGHEEEWGQFLDVKINAPEVLEAELAKNPKVGKIFLSSVTDLYLPAEKKYKITRKILDILSKHDYPVSILTKSKIILRDLDILKKIKNLEVGISICQTNEQIREKLEPTASSIVDRLETLRILHENNIPTYVFLSPIIPYVTNLEEIFEAVEDKIDRIGAEAINIKCGNWDELYSSIKEFVKVDEQRLKQMIQSQQVWDKAEEKVKALCEKHKIKFTGFYRH